MEAPKFNFGKRGSLASSTQNISEQDMDDEEVTVMERAFSRSTIEPQINNNNDRFKIKALTKKQINDHMDKKSFWADRDRNKKRNDNLQGESMMDSIMSTTRNIKTSMTKQRYSSLEA